MHKFEKTASKTIWQLGDTSCLKEVLEIRKWQDEFLFCCGILSGSFLSIPKTSSANNQISIGKSSLVSAWG